MSKGQDLEYQWVKSSKGDAPPGTLAVGQDINGEPLYVARATHNGDLIPGKLVSSHHCAYVSWGRQEFGKDNYEVLVGNSEHWVAASGSNIPSGAFPGGETVLGETLYVGRVLYKGHYTPGKVQKSQGLCYIPFNSKELEFKEYEILCY